MARYLITAVVLFSMIATADTPYPITENAAKENRKAVEAFSKDAYWKGAPIAAAAVDPMSPERFLPDVMPDGGDFTGPVKVVAAQGEYENASVVLFGFKDIGEVKIVVRDIRGPGGVIPVSEIDVKVVKTWYQQGTAWYGGFQSDFTRRVLTPELMLHDESLVHVDYSRKENFLRCNYGGEQAYRWISTTARAVDHNGCAEPNCSFIHDADAPKPFSLQANCFKQIIFTIHVPRTLAGGLYKGTFGVVADGEKAFDIPILVRVLPFELPKPMTFRDTSRRFYASGYLYQNINDYPRLAADLAAHGVDTAYMFKRTGMSSPSRAKASYEIVKKFDLNSDLLMCVLPGASITTSFPVQEWNKNYQAYLNRIEEAENCIKVIRDSFGPHARPYAYAIDEAPPETIRAERAIWQAYQKMGAGIVASTGFHPYLLFNLDAANIPRQPRTQSKANADSLHDANPDFIASWYGDPHSGPESPDYNRRIYGWLTWRNNYDMFSQYIIERDDWSEFYVWKEPFLRGLMIVYPQDDGIIDTLAWEGVREAVDDIRYGTLLKQLAEKARKSADIDTSYAGRAALTWVAQVDFQRSSLESLRLETVNRILDLMTRLEKEGK